jgi:type VI secretion system protein ImpF
MIPPARRPPPRAQLPLLERLIDDGPDQLSPGDAMATLRNSVRRDLEALLNARRRWRPWAAHLSELKTSAIGYGIPDFTAGVLSDPKQREMLRAEIEATIRRFEPRFAMLSVSVIDGRDALEPVLRLRIEALLHAEPADEPIAFDTLVDATTAEVIVRAPGMWENV